MSITSKNFISDYKKILFFLSEDIKNNNKKKKQRIDEISFSKKLLKQIIILYFLGKTDFLCFSNMRQLLEKAVNGNKNFFKDYLLPMTEENPFWGVFCRYDSEEKDVFVDNKVFSNTEKAKQSENGSGILDIFDCYDFIIDKNNQTLNENEITTEILSDVYEELLDSAYRKAKGTFYTPKEIVNYMCKSCLVNYLTKVLNISDSLQKSSENNILTIKEISDFVYCFNKDSLLIKVNAEKIDNALAEIKIFDSSIGSGAFVVGMVNEIVSIRRLLVEAGFLMSSKSRSLLAYKQHALKNSIYGIDIDADAVEITKLRLIFSLLSDGESEVSLPNLDNNIVQGNSLLVFEKSQLKNYELFQEIIDNGGFDVVVSNPPYVGEKGHKDVFEPIKNSSMNEFYIGKMDLFYFFFHQSLNILKNGGCCSFITTNYYTTALGARLLREDLKKRAVITELLNFNELKIFNSAVGQHNIITTFIKAYNPNANCRLVNVNKKGFLKNDFKNIVLGRDKETSYCIASQLELYEGKENYIRLFKDKEHNELNSIFDKMRDDNDLLGNICKINTGIYTAKDDVFVLDKTFASEKMILNKLEKSLLKPMFKNSDINKFFTNNESQKLLIYHYEKAEYSHKEIPNIYKYLCKYKDVLLKRRDNSLKGALKRGRWDVMALPKLSINFSSPKIVAPQRSKLNTFGYNEIPWFASADVYFITEPKQDYDLKYILCLLNSKLYYEWLKYKGKRKGDTLELYKKPLSEIPVKKTDCFTQKKFITVVNKILKLSEMKDSKGSEEINKEIKEYENWINLMVYKLYNLTYSEVLFIDKDFFLSQKQYEKFIL